jgi:PKHD-type hydroxylase
MLVNQYHYWYFENTISDEEINYIFDIANNRWKRGKTFKVEGEHTRESDIVWTEDQKLYDLIWPYMLEANRQLTNFDIDYAESMQITRYQKNEFYDYHIDGTGISYYDEPSSEIFHNRTRKLSMSLLLNDDFEGGELELKESEPIENKKGKMIFFPSFFEHRVLPVTKGVRYSLVCWFLGPPLR